MSEEQKWFYEQDGEQKGPVSEITIRGMVSSGVIPKETLIWREGLADWTPFESSELSAPGNLAPALAPGAVPFRPRQAKLNPDFDFGISKALGAGWNLMLSDFWPFVGFFALASIIFGVASNLVLPIFFLTFPMMGGYMYFTLKRLRGEPGDVDNVFDGFKRRFGSLALLSFLVWIPIMILLLPLMGLIFYASSKPEWIEANLALGVGLLGGGFLLFIVIMSIVSTTTTIAALLCLDCDISWSKALDLAGKAYMKHFFKMTVFSIVSTFLINLGVLVFYVGCFVSGAWIVSSISYVYEKAFGDLRSCDF